jgi:MerR family redox-sensitive transcriptional activator SoxR
MDENLTIGELASIAGVATSTLHYYEEIGLMPPPKRVSGQRRYGSEALQILAVIQLGKDASFNLPEIRDLLYGFADSRSVSERWKDLARQKLHETDAVIAHMLEMKARLEEGLRCDPLLFELDSIPQLASPDFDAESQNERLNRLLL